MNSQKRKVLVLGLTMVLSILACNLPGDTRETQNYRDNPIEPIQLPEDPLDSTMATSDDLQPTSLPTITLSPTNTLIPSSTNTPIPPTSTYTPVPPTSTYTPVPPTVTETVVFFNNASIVGSVYWDKNGNGIRDSSQGEFGLANKEIKLYDRECDRLDEPSLHVGIQHTEMWTGNYRFDNISDNTRCLAIEFILDCNGKSQEIEFYENVKASTPGEIIEVEPLGAACPLVFQP